MEQNAETASKLQNPDPAAPRPAAPRLPVPNPGPAHSSLGSKLFIAVVVVLIIGAGVWGYRKQTSAGVDAKGGDPKAGAKSAGGKGGGGAIPVVSGKVVQKDVPIYLDGLGTVQAFNTVAIRPRVDGQLEKVAFTEGQDVQKGDVLAKIDPAPFQTALDQATAKKGQDSALLANAKLDLAREVALVAQKIDSQQALDTAQAQVNQLDAAVKADEAAIESAKIQLDYTTITSPIDGRTGIRLVDQGNIVHANDTNGLVVITQLRPISVIFTLPEQNLDAIAGQMAKGELTILAMDRDNKGTLGEGKLAVIDNQIDTTTATIKLKATFPNTDHRLWPGQFVNARLQLTTRKNGIVVPASVIQRGPDGTYAFVINPDMSVQIRPVKVAFIEGNDALIDSGLKQGESVVVDGQYKLQPGSKVKVGKAGKAAESDSGP